MKPITAFHIVKMMEQPWNFFLAHFGIKELKQMQLRNGVVLEGPSLAALYTVVSTPYEYETYMLKNPKVVVDIGACIGGFAFFVAHKFKTAKVYAYEPNPRVLPCLKANVQKNKMDRVIPRGMAVAGSIGETSFNIVEGLGSSIIGHGSKSVKVKTTSLAAIIKEVGHINYLKMDAEGAEYEIIFKCPPTLLKKVYNMGLEYHRVKGRSYKQLLKYLEDNGFRILKHEPKQNGMGIIVASSKL